MSTFKEAEEVISKLKKKDSANKKNSGIVEKYDTKTKEFVEKMTVGTVLLNREKKINDFVYRVISNKNNEELIRYTICECKLNEK